MNELERYKLYLRTVGLLIKEDALEIRKTADESDEEDRIFWRGKL